MAQMAMGNVADTVAVDARPVSNQLTNRSAVVPPPEVLQVLHEKNKKPRPMIPESDVIKAARARAAMAGGEVVASAAALELRASARLKGEKAAAARQLAIAKAEAARAAAATASELARLAEETKVVAAGMEKARVARAAAQDEKAMEEPSTRLRDVRDAIPTKSSNSQRKEPAQPEPVSVD
jgi:hypothetical protein